MKPRHIAATAAVVCMVYTLSAFPVTDAVFWSEHNKDDTMDKVYAFYAPVYWLYHNFSPFRSAMDRYVELLPKRSIPN